MADPNSTNDAPEGRGDTYDPSTVEANRAREQGGGVGQKDLDAQRDPAGAGSASQSSAPADSDEADPQGEPASDDKIKPEIGNGEGGKLGGAM